MVLNLDFIIYGSILIAFLIPLYIYRQKIFSFAYKTGSLEFFINDVKLHMKKEYPKIPLDYSIIKKTEDEKDIRIRQTLIVEDIINQFFNHEYTKKTQNPVSRDKLWTNYDEKSMSNSKSPSDWLQRKELAWSRDNHRCNRCGNEIKLNDAMSTFAKDIHLGGGYNLENVIILCSDCNMILKSKDAKKTIHSLKLNDELMFFVQS